MRGLGCLCAQRSSSTYPGIFCLFLAVGLSPGWRRSAEMMGNAELAPEVDVGALEPLLSPHVVSELLDTYMSTLTVSRTVRAQGADAAAALPGRGPSEGARAPRLGIGS